MTAVHLPAAGPFDAAAALALLRAHTIPGAERTEGEEHQRLVRVAVRGDEPALVRVRLDATGVRLEADEDAVAELVPRVRRWFDLDVDQAARNDHLSADPALAPLVAARPGLRITGHPDPFEAALGIVVGQQVSVAAARTVTGRLVAGFGSPGPGGLLAYPTPQRLAAVEVDELRATCGFMASRARTVATLARAVADGLSLHPTSPQELATTRRDLLALPGIGPWTVDFLALRALGDPDAFPAGDLVLKRALGAATDKQAVALAEPWRPYRAFAALHLWTQAAYLA